MTARQIWESLQSGAIPEPSILRQLARDAAEDRELTAALFRDLIEPLSDSFSPQAAEQYKAIFGEMLREFAVPLRAIGVPIRDRADVTRVFILSRITIGADIAITSVLMDAAKRAFPNASIVLVGPRKNAELWAADSRVRHVEAPYDRTGTLRGRIDAHRALIPMLNDPSCIVIDPDSRLTQLGLIAVCPPERYFLFPSRAFGATTGHSLPRLAAQWAEEQLYVAEAKPYLAMASIDSPSQVTVSFGTGENSAKRVSEAFEIFVLQELVRQGARVLVDTGAGGEEARRVQLAVEQTSGLPGQVETFSGSFAHFAARIARSPLYIGYDSAGQHAAAALEVPTVTVFAGYPNERFLERWRPTGPAKSTVLLASGANLFERLREAIHSALIQPNKIKSS